jgi:hypothetical protein
VGSWEWEEEEEEEEEEEVKPRQPHASGSSMVPKRASFSHAECWAGPWRCVEMRVATRWQRAALMLHAGALEVCFVPIRAGAAGVRGAYLSERGRQV